MNQLVLLQIIVIILATALLYCFVRAIRTDKVYTFTAINNKKYLVQNTTNRQDASNMLGIVQQRIDLLTDYLNRNIDSYPEFRPYIRQLIDQKDKIILIENSPHGPYTSYTVNKGDKIALCLRSKTNGNLHDINLVMYVVLHELAHVACPEIDHTPLFKKIFIFLLEVSIGLGIYQRDNYQSTPVEYCGLTISENLLS